MRVSQSLDIVEDEPSERDHHQNDERDRDEENRRFVDVVVRQLLQSAERDVQHQLQ